MTITVVKMSSHLIRLGLTANSRYASVVKLLLVPPPHLGITSGLLLLSDHCLVRSEPAIRFDHAAQGHTGHLKKTKSRVNLPVFPGTIQHLCFSVESL